MCNQVWNSDDESPSVEQEVREDVHGSESPLPVGPSVGRGGLAVVSLLVRVRDYRPLPVLLQASNENSDTCCCWWTINEAPIKSGDSNAASHSILKTKT